MAISPVTLDAVKNLPAHEQQALLGLIKELEQAKARDVARATFIGYAKHMWPAFIEGKHHHVMSKAFDRIIEGSLKRLIINMPPRHTKSEFSSFLLPSKFLGHYPDKKVIQTSHTAELAVGFGRKVRNLVVTKEYQELYPGLQLIADSKAAGRWATSRGGEYFAIGTGGAVTGKGADLFIIDDPHSEQDGQMAQVDPTIFDAAYEWYTSGPRQRLQPGAAIVITMTRWGKRDMTGRVISAMTERHGMDQWEVIEFPMEMPSGKVLWPEYWSQEEMEVLKAELPPSKWNAQYQQNPTSEGAALVKRSWWKIWDKDQPPLCKFVIQSWDTAYLKTQRADYCACTTWGVFDMPSEDGPPRNNIILLDAMRKRMEFPELKKLALEMWKKRRPDAFIVEAKAAGLPLIQELRAMGIPVSEFTPTRGNDKFARLNACSDLFASGMVWAPATRWADEVIDEIASFPGDHDDYVDSSTQALLRFRQGGFVSLQSDHMDKPKYRKTANYY